MCFEKLFPRSSIWDVVEFSRLNILEAVIEWRNFSLLETSTHHCFLYHWLQKKSAARKPPSIKTNESSLVLVDHEHLKTLREQLILPIPERSIMSISRSPSSYRPPKIRVSNGRTDRPTDGPTNGHTLLQKRPKYRMRRTQICSPLPYSQNYCGDFMN